MVELVPVERGNLFLTFGKAGNLQLSNMGHYTKNNKRFAQIDRKEIQLLVRGMYLKSHLIAN